MRKLLIATILLLSTFLLQFCSSSKKAGGKKHIAVTYDANILPVIQTSCSPCHIEGKGKKKPLDNYANASGAADDIIARIQKDPGDHGFMPAMHPKLSDSTINIFIQWKNDGLKENASK